MLIVLIDEGHEQTVRFKSDEEGILLAIVASADEIAVVVEGEAVAPLEAHVSGEELEGLFEPCLSGCLPRPQYIGVGPPSRFAAVDVRNPNP
jgi:hypothetical protein